MTSVLITGGTGLIGKQLSHLLTLKGYRVLLLSRTKNAKPNSYYWDIEKEVIEEEAIQKADYIIHLAGAGIADKRWTEKRKKEIINSRVKSTELLLKKVKQYNPNLKAFIAASGVGYYGAVTSEKIFNEHDKPGNDFLANVCKLWENASLQFQKIDVRTVLLRTGVVFSKQGGALKKLSTPIKMGIGAPLGNGQQHIPWIHIEDLCKMYIYTIENQHIEGIYNAVAPEHITNNELTKSMALVLKKPLWAPKIPSFFLKLILGEMAVILLEGSRISSYKIEKTGFQFQFPTLVKTLKSFNL